MNDRSTLERRIQAIEDVEAIKKVKIKYWNSLDDKRWDDLADCFTEDFVYESLARGKVEGRDKFMELVTKGLEHAVTVHQGHNPDIELTTDTTARARWAINYYEKYPDRFVRGYGYYEDQYVKHNGNWKIKSSLDVARFIENSSATAVHG